MPVDWKLYEKEVIDKYVNGEMNAEETIRHLLHMYGVNITQFKSKFGGLKKLRRDEWRAVFSEIRNRETHGLASEVYLYGRQLSSERVARERRRYVNDYTVQRRPDEIASIV
ncbi:hypothetical protein G7Z17_g4531 [Cylindrodendrum hubeiense]|uniref:Clr5 domain-containing protein n=1 Tax=Cylindrodendrum hubeiense TaxID=595255 RepID=A0A9P5HDQ2_9HYPO|nr:hypothetical protein G7Z17_g4531 [Cylindrodendrum hubeiense]